MIKLKELDIREVFELLKLRREDAWDEGEPYIEIDINEVDAIIKALQNR